MNLEENIKDNSVLKFGLIRNKKIEWKISHRKMLSNRSHKKRTTDQGLLCDQLNNYIFDLTYISEEWIKDKHNYINFIN